MVWTVITVHREESYISLILCIALNLGNNNKKSVPANTRRAYLRCLATASVSSDDGDWMIINSIHYLLLHGKHWQL